MYKFSSKTSFFTSKKELNRCIQIEDFGVEKEFFVRKRKGHNAKSWLRKVNFKLSVNLLNIEYPSLVFDIEAQIESNLW